MMTLFNAGPRSLSAPRVSPPQSRAVSPTRLAGRNGTKLLVNLALRPKTAQADHVSRRCELWECMRRLTLTENKEPLYQPLCLSFLLCRSKQFLPRRQPVRRAVVVDLFYLFT